VLPSAADQFILGRLAFTNWLFLSATPYKRFQASSTAQLEILDDQRLARAELVEKLVWNEWLSLVGFVAIILSTVGLFPLTFRMQRLAVLLRPTR
jgi:hypothetical protein